MAARCGDRDGHRPPRTAEPTPHGVRWQHRRDAVTRMLHISHGTLGMVYALAAVGEATAVRNWSTWRWPAPRTRCPSTRRELLRFTSIKGDGDPGYAVTWPDHPTT